MVASASRSRRRKRSESVGRSNSAERGLPGITSRSPWALPDQPDGTIACLTIFCLGAESTSAMSSGVVTGTSSPVDASACGSMSMTSVGIPRLWAAEARPSATEVFPTPPLRLETLMTST